MTNDREALSRALTLGAISGLKATYGPALLTASRRSPGWQALALAALAEMAIDKQPMVPSRSSPLGMLPRALAGYWVARSSMADSRALSRDPAADYSVGLAGAAAAVGVAAVAPTLRWALRRTFRVPDLVIGLAEDALALKVGGQAVGMSPSDLLDAGQAALSEAQQGRAGEAFQQLRGQLLSG